MAAQRVTFIKAKVADVPGAVLAILQDLKSKNIALKCLWGFAKREGDSEINAVPKDIEKLRNVWKSAGIYMEEGNALFLKGTDKTGVLIKSLETLSKENISMKALHAIAAGGKYGTIILVDPADLEKAVKALGAK
jgi:hypothetical protein